MDKTSPRPELVRPLKAGQLFTPCDPKEFAFRSTEELEPLTEMVGQDRAVSAVEFAVDMDLQGFNVFVLGSSGTGRHSFIRRYLSHRSSEGPAAADWVYINNFEEPRKPLVLELPQGRGRRLRADMERLVDEAYTAIPTAFESEGYQARRQAIQDEFGQEQARRFQEIQKRARERGIALIQRPSGIVFAPLRNDKTMSSQEFEQLPEEERKRFEEETQDLNQELQHILQAMPKLVRNAHEKIRDLDREIAMLAAGSLLDNLLEKYAEFPKVVAYLKQVQADMIENVGLFLASPGKSTPVSPDQTSSRKNLPRPKESEAKNRYSVNLLVDNAETRGAPLVFEDHPTYPNLVGEIENLAQMGALVTDFTLIKSGALHRANGGFLVLDAHKVLTEPFAWQGLKIALKSRKIRIESLGQAFSLTSTATLEPEPVPLNVKVVMIGDRLVYYLLQALDPEFLELFKVPADFDDWIDRSKENNQLFAQLLGTLAQQENLKPLDPPAVARLIEEGARHADHAGKLSAQVRRSADIMREANHWATKNAKDVVGRDDIERTIEGRIYRVSRLRERLQEQILEDTILIATEGERVGQVNGLAVLQLGEYSFARPNRISARVSLGSGKVVDIEREAKLGGPLHSKGVLILSGYLSSHFVTDQPLSLSASLVLEQSYGGIEGDSASSAELYALLSALAQIPIKQNYAVTGSVNQHGEIQAIGGVNEKIEGFFEICQARGLNGDQGVLIPVSNVRHLMLRRSVIEAVEAGQFHIYPVQRIEEGMEILTGLAAGEPDASGDYPEGTIHDRVRRRLIELAEKRRQFALGGNSEPPVSE